MVGQRENAVTSSNFEVEMKLFSSQRVDRLAGSEWLAGFIILVTRSPELISLSVTPQLN